MKVGHTEFLDICVASEIEMFKGSGSSEERARLEDSA